MTGLIIPDNVAAPAGSRLSLLMAASKFREAAKDYEEKGSKPVPSRPSQARRRRGSPPPVVIPPLSCLQHRGRIWTELDFQ